MKFLILDGHPNGGKQFYDDYLAQFCSGIEAKGHHVKKFVLREMDIHQCIGCWSCWWKTPGRCVFKDGAETLYPEMVHADRLVFASPLIMGFISSTLKRMHDRSIPLIHPYMDIVNGEVHHRKRYPKYPKLGVLLKPEVDTDSEDLEIVRRLYKRFSINFRTSLDFFATMQSNNLEEVVDEACRI
jgi:multimeric flavodoxin WrbA